MPAKAGISGRRTPRQRIARRPPSLDHRLSPQPSLGWWSWVGTRHSSPVRGGGPLAQRVVEGHRPNSSALIGSCPSVRRSAPATSPCRGGMSASGRFPPSPVRSFPARTFPVLEARPSALPVGSRPPDRRKSVAPRSPCKPSPSSAHKKRPVFPPAFFPVPIHRDQRACIVLRAILATSGNMPV